MSLFSKKTYQENKYALPYGIVLATAFFLAMIIFSICYGNKAYMGDEETMLVGSWKITYRETVSKRIDSAELKKVLGDCLDPYYKTVITRPFRIA